MWHEMKFAGTGLLAWGISLGLCLTVVLPSWAGDEDLATGPSSTMHMLLEKTFLGFDVLRVTVRVDKATQRRLVALTQGKRYSENLATQIANIGARLSNASAEIRFVRNIRLDQFLDGVRESLQLAHRAGLITAENRRQVSDALPRWYAFLQRRGIKDGDRIVYRVRPSSLRTRYISADGAVMLDQTDSGTDPRRALLGGYFAPGADFRDGLIRSLF